MSGFKDHFSAAAGYADFRPVYPAELAGVLASLCEQRRCAWDCGCGTGQLSALLAAHFEHVEATDASAEQIRRAAGPGNVRFHAAPAEHGGLEAGSVDLIVAAQAAHWFDLPAFYGEVRRVASGPRAVVALICYGRSVVDEGGLIDAAVERVYSGVLGPYWPPERRHVEEGYANLPFPFDQAPPGSLPAMEMQEWWSRDALIGYINTWSAVRAAQKAGVTGVIERFATDLAVAWPDSAALRLVRWPLSVRVGYVGAGAGRAE